MLDPKLSPRVPAHREGPVNNTIPCFLKLWGKVTKVMHAGGKRFAISIDDSRATPFNDSATQWSYEWDWIHFVNFTCVAN